MPRPTLPPTPASSTDLPGKDAPPLSSGLEQSFALPPPALAPRPDMDAGRMPTRRRAPAARSTATLPPPPTRSRKIIHMRPQPALTSAEEGLSAALKPARGPAPAAVDGNGKRKEPTATSAAGRRIARKTAHSLIERRRRSKMNEEFGVLKQMIPACRGHEMHKLAILQVRKTPAPDHRPRAPHADRAIGQHRVPALSGAVSRRSGADLTAKAVSGPCGAGLAGTVGSLVGSGGRR